MGDSDAHLHVLVRSSNHRMVFIDFLKLLKSFSSCGCFLLEMQCDTAIQFRMVVLDEIVRYVEAYLCVG